MSNNIYNTEIGIVVAGSVDSGKSTFVGVLTSGKLDDGDGSARLEVAKHPHEKASKKTSDIASKNIITKSKKCVILFDLCGHEKYFKTTTYGIAGHFPDYAIMIIGANRGILPMTKQHMTTLMSLNIPVIIIVTRYDITPENTYNETMKHIEIYCKNVIKIPPEIINNPYTRTHNASFSIENMLVSNKQLCIPVITVSNKNGYYIDYINDIFDRLSPRKIWNNFIDNIEDKNIEERCTNRVIKKFMSNMDPHIFREFTNISEHVFFIDTIYNPVGIGIVVTGINRGGDINVGDTMYLGPFGKEFKQIRIKSMNNYCQQHIQSAKDHQRITIAIASNDKEINKRTVRKGMVIIKSKELANQNVCWNFNAIITIFNHSTTLKNNYSPSLQIGNVRQSGRMTINPELNNGNDHIKLKEFGNVSFKFKFRPEFIEKYQTFIFRSGNVHGVGIVTDIVPISKDSDVKADPIKGKIKKIKY